MKVLKLTTLLLIVALGIANCKGDPICGATVDPLSDHDSDCVENTADNCPLVYNPSQVDVDEDSLGDACDDDVSTSASLSSAFTIFNFSDVEIQGYLFNEDNLSSENTNCVNQYIVSCFGEFLGTLAEPDSVLSIYNPNSRFGDATQRQSVYHEQNYFVRPDSECSAFNDNAPWPPLLHCIHANDGTTAQPITTNPEFENRISPCDVFLDHPISAKFCN